MRRQRLVLAAAILAVVLATAAVVLRRQEDRITQDNCDRIREGMTPAEVEAILGPQGDYRNGPTEPEYLNPYPSGIDWDWAEVWQGDRGAILVYRKGHDPCIIGSGPDRVEGARFVEVQRVQQNPLANLVWLAKRQWRHWFPE
jgi:hypothetical protein